MPSLPPNQQRQLYTFSVRYIAETVSNAQGGRMNVKQNNQNCDQHTGTSMHGRSSPQHQRDELSPLSPLLLLEVGPLPSILPLPCPSLSSLPSLTSRPLKSNLEVWGVL